MTNFKPGYTCPADGKTVRHPGSHANHFHSDLRPTKFRRLLAKMLAAKVA
jgi:hypothetical protein